MLLNLRSCSGLSAIQRAENLIDALSPAAWYHMRGSGVPTSSGGFASMWPDMADTDNGLVLPGVNGNSATSPDAAPLDITGDIDLICKVALTDWVPAATQTLVAKDQTSTTTSYRLEVGATGLLSLVWSTDGTAGATLITNSTVATGVTDGATKWVRATLDVDDGGGNRVIKFYTSDDGSAWAQLGTTITTAGTTSIFSGTSQLEVGGARNKTAQMVSGIVYRAIVKNGIDGTTVFDADFSAQAKGTTSFTESSSNAATVTVNKSGALPAHIGNKKDLLQGTGTNQPAYSAGVITFDGVDNYLKTNAFTLNQPETIYIVFKQITWASSDGIFDGNTSGSGMLQQNAITPNLGIQANNYCPDLITGMAVNTYGIVTVVFNGASSYISLNDGENATANAGTQNMGAFILGARGSALNPSNVAVKEAIIFSAAHDAATRTSVINALNTLNTVF